MTQPDALTFTGALRILGHHDSKMLDRISDVTGGLILASGAVAGVAALAGAGPAAPLALFLAAWGWVDQKNEGIGLLRKMINWVPSRAKQTSGLERRQLIAACHTALVVCSFFEALEDEIGSTELARLKLSARDKADLAQLDGGASRSLVNRLYTTDVPSPSSSWGFLENTDRVRLWMSGVAQRATGLLESHPRWLLPIVSVDPIVRRATERYISHYVDAARLVPEFFIWSMLAENAATRALVGEAAGQVRQVLAEQSTALARLEQVLHLTGASRAPLDACLTLERANRGVIKQPIVPREAERYDTPVTFPAIEEIFLPPRYRMCHFDPAGKPADESWWEAQPSKTNLDLMLAAHVLSSNSTRQPMLILGHPGAGKSMLTKVIAARLPAADYTVVRVPLRSVGANAPILDQVQLALDQATNRRVDWAELAEQSAGTTRVVLLDGLDELLQASSSDRSGYLQDVMRFQQIEYDQGRPIIVAVTSRTVVADRVDIPHGTTVIKLDDFEPDQVGQWLGAWHDANAEAIADGAVRELPLSTALRQPDLVRQPLLLLMLALYAADPQTPRLDDAVSTASLYERLLDNFARREVAKHDLHGLGAAEVDAAVEAQLDRLSTAALGMFNRGAQHISEDDLGADLTALRRGQAGSREAQREGQRLLGEFFFVHTAEATLLGAGGERQRVADRSFEFLHATFGEYLVARRVIDELRDSARRGLGRFGSIDYDDDMLFALLSHQPLSVRRSSLAFAADVFSRLPEAEQSSILAMLSVLAAGYRWRNEANKYPNYQPMRLNRLRQLAAYSANLVLLRVILRPDDVGVPTTELMGADDGQHAWQATVHLWRSGLDMDGWHSVLNALVLRDESVAPHSSKTSLPPGFANIEHALLAGDEEQAAVLRFGLASHAGLAYDDEQRWAVTMLSWIRAHLTGSFHVPFILIPPPAHTPRAEVEEVAEGLMQVMRTGTGDGGSLPMQQLLRYYLSLDCIDTVDPFAITMIVRDQPGLIKQIKQLRDPRFYSQDGSSFLILSGAIAVAEGEDKAALRKLITILPRPTPAQWNRLNRLDHEAWAALHTVFSQVGPNIADMYARRNRFDSDDSKLLTLIPEVVVDPPDLFLQEP